MRQHRLVSLVAAAAAALLIAGFLLSRAPWASAAARPARVTAVAAATFHAPLGSEAAATATASAEPTLAVEAETETDADAAATPVADKVVVVGKLASQDTDWIAAELPDWGRAIYTVDDPLSPLHTTTNKGREALPYLRYLIDNYARLPHTIAFVHAHRSGYPDAWHTDNDEHSNPLSLQTLNLSLVQAAGYVNLRCAWEPGCTPGSRVRPLRSPPDPRRETEHEVAGAWVEFFGGEGRAVPDEIGVACCAQFAVSGAQVRKRPRADYERFHRWVLETRLSDDVAGRVLEYFWHVIFGMEAVHCPDATQCYGDVYGSWDVDW